MISRRALLAATALAVPSLALVGCAGMSPAQTVAAIASDVSTIAQGLEAEVPALTATGAIPAVAMAEYSAAVTGLKALADQIAAAATASAAQPLVQQVEGLVNAAVAIVAKIPLVPAPIAAVLQAISLILPVVEVGVGLVATQLKLPPAAPSTSAAVVLKTPDDARAFLKSLAR